jgi:hypothetical protein
LRMHGISHQRRQAMETQTDSRDTNHGGWREKARRHAPVLVLLLLAPFVAEVLGGSTPASMLAGFPLSVGLYGTGALLVREVARKRGLGWISILLFGAAFGVIEEGLVLQSMFNPHFLGLDLTYGRVLGVNWAWAESLVFYHALLSITVPILLTELLFPSRRAEPWVGKVGLRVTGSVYLLSCLFFAFVIRPVAFPYAAPPVLLAGSALVAAALVGLGLHVRPRASGPKLSTRVPPPWVVGLLAFAVCSLWLNWDNFGPWITSNVPALMLMGTWVLIVATAAVLISRWSRMRGWTDPHYLALGAAAILALAIHGHFVASEMVPAASTVNSVGQAVAAAMMVALLVFVARGLRKRAAEPRSGTRGVVEAREGERVS